MSRTNKILAVVLALQFVLLGVRAVWPSSSNNKIAPGGVLVANFDPATLHDWDKVGEAMITMARSWPEPLFNNTEQTAATVAQKQGAIAL